MDIRKTDSKGRISIGTPGIHYRVDRVSGGHLHLSPVFDLVEFVPTPATDDAQKYLHSFGLDPMLISREGADEYGYNEFVVKNGEIVKAINQRIITRKTWPEGFDWFEFLSLNGVPI